MLGRVCWEGNIGLREMVSLRDRPDSGGPARYGWSIWRVGLECIPNRMGCIWWEGHIENEKYSVEKSWKQDRRLTLANLLTSFTEAFYSSEKSGFEPQFSSKVSLTFKVDFCETRSILFLAAPLDRGA
jgi:hypothetical protein